MSGLHTSQKAMRRLKSLINEFSPDGGVGYYFITSFPKSDMGKGTLVAQLLSITEDSDAIKFDGLLNTNSNGRHTARGHDDFGIYEEFNRDRVWGDEHYLLGGELYRDFIQEFGELENLQINPHFSLYVEYRIHKMWVEIGKPRHLFIELGGVITDPEVDSIFSPLIRRLADRIDAKTILLGESATNGEHIKTKSIQDAVNSLQSRRIEPWLVVAREPIEFKDASLDERIEYERVISDKINTNVGKRFNRIISVPFYKDIHDYTSYMKQRFTSLIVNPKADDGIVIATGNDSKFADFKLYLEDEYDLVQSTELSDGLLVPEGINSIEDNAIAKARAWAIATGKVCIADDTGFFINSLHGEPGVALRRWGGELGEGATNEDFWLYLQSKTENLENLSCYLEQCIAIYSPNGELKLVFSRNEGYLNKDKLYLPYNGSGYPLGAAFESKNRKKTWDEMTDQEKKDFDSKLIGDLKQSLNEL